MRVCGLKTAAPFAGAGRSDRFFSRKRVAKYKYPERIVIVEKLPRTASGKVQKFLLRQDIIERLRQEHTAVIVGWRR